MLDTQHIITPEEITELARPCAADEDIAARFIEEAEQNDIRPALGDALFLSLMSGLSAPAYDALLNGGEYLDQCNAKRYFVGLKKTVAYYAYARIVKSGTHLLTRYNFGTKQDEYSRAAEFKERNQAYNDAFSIADHYMRDCLNYIQSQPSVFPEYTQDGEMTANRIRYKIIGD